MKLKMLGPSLLYLFVGFVIIPPTNLAFSLFISSNKHSFKYLHKISLKFSFITASSIHLFYLKLGLLNYNLTFE